MLRNILVDSLDNIQLMTSQLQHWSSDTIMKTKITFWNMVFMIQRPIRKTPAAHFFPPKKRGMIPDEDDVGWCFTATSVHMVG